MGTGLHVTFEAETIGTYPSTFTELWGGSDVTVQDFDGVRTVRFNNPTDSTEAHRLDGHTLERGVDGFDVKMLVYCTNLSGSHPVCTSLSLDGTSHATRTHRSMQFNGTTARFLRHNNGSGTYLTGDFTPTADLNEWIWMRMRVLPNGDTYEGKIWRYVDAEPETWNASGSNDSALLTDQVGLFMDPSTDRQFYLASYSVVAHGGTHPEYSLEGEPLSTTKIMCVGDSITAGSSGGTNSAPTYRYELFKFWRDNNLLDSMIVVGPYFGITDNNEEPNVSGGWTEWSQDDSRHASKGGNSTSQLAALIQSWVSTYEPDVIIYFGAFINQGTVTESDFQNFIDNARSAKSDLKFIMGLPYYGHFSTSDTDQYRTRLTTVAIDRHSAESPIILVDHMIRWDSSLHAGGIEGESEDRYPNPTGNARIAMRWSDAILDSFDLGDFWYKPDTPTLSLSGNTLMWDDNIEKTDEYDIELDNTIIDTVIANNQYGVTSNGTYKVRGRRTI